jgi:hypothetical protein
VNPLLRVMHRIVRETLDRRLVPHLYL